MKRIEIESAWEGAKECQGCSIRKSALFAEMDEGDFQKIHDPIDDLHFSVGELIYQQSKKAGHIFTLRKGFVKLLLLNADGTERIVRVIKPGDLFGMEALTESCYQHNAIALELVELCKIPSREIKLLSESSPRLNRQLMNKWSEALSESQTWFAQLNTGRADVRVARFLIRFSREVNGVVESPLFKREDLGLMMDLKFETISRSLASLANLGLIGSPSKHFVHIPNLDKLKEFCS